MKSKELLVEFYEPADDVEGQADYDDTRRPRLTLTHLHKMRKSRDVERVDKKDYLDFLPSMYDQSAE